MAKADHVTLEIVADWGGQPFRLGELTAYDGVYKDTFSFVFDAMALEHPDLRGIRLDPDLHSDAGPQFIRSTAKNNFGMFLDSSPDRWGRLIMDRQLERLKRAGKADPKERLRERHYFLGVHDAYRVGALRVRLAGDGVFLATEEGISAPPMVGLRELEEATRALEQEESSDRVDHWLRMLLAPGGSLGGARPKASVVDVDGSLWIAKFPSYRDDIDVGAWELVLQVLARACGIDAPEARAQAYYSKFRTYVVKRFDRRPDGRRIHFASAMTLTGRADGDDAAAGASYLELARVLATGGADPQTDLPQLWRRIVFNICVSNADDHLRNHGFLLEPGRGWRLAPAYDVNPVPDAHGLRINVSKSDNALDLDLALSVAGDFRVAHGAAKKVVKDIASTVKQWRALAAELKISPAEQQRMGPAFRRADGF